MTRFLSPAVVLAALTLTGCGEKTTDVTGKVTYKGKALAYGTVAILDGGPAPKGGAGVTAAVVRSSSASRRSTAFLAASDPGGAALDTATLWTPSFTPLTR